MKKHNSRSTLAKQIRNLVQGDNVMQTFKAQELATFGRQLTPVEDLVRMYYATKHELNTKERRATYFRQKVIIRRQGEKKISTNFGAIAKLAFKNIKANLVANLMTAIDADDFQKIQELANAVRFLKGRKRPHPVPLDVDREILLSIKVHLGGEKVTIREIAECLAKRKKYLGLSQTSEIESSADGFSALRRKCREINLPLASAKKNKPLVAPSNS